MTRPPLAALLLGLALSLPVRAAVVDRVAAVVNDDVITLTEVYDLGEQYIDEQVQQDSSRRQAELDVLDALIQRRLVSQEITRLGLDVTDTELDRTIDDVARRNGLDRENLRTEVEVSGIPWDQYRDELRENLRQMKFTQQVIRPRITVNEDELKAAYVKMTRAAELPAVAELGAFFLGWPVDADDAAREAVVQQAQAGADRVAGGEDFAAVAAEVDQGPYGAQGGNMGSYRQGELVGDLDQTAFALQPGQTSAPVSTAQGVFVLHMFSRSQAEGALFDDVRDQLFQKVYSSRIDDETEQWTAQARRQAAVVIQLGDTADSTE